MRTAQVIVLFVATVNVDAVFNLAPVKSRQEPSQTVELAQATAESGKIYPDGPPEGMLSKKIYLNISISISWQFNFCYLHGLQQPKPINHDMCEPKQPSGMAVSAMLLYM